MTASIIITTYKRPIFLEKAITSCINQKTSFPFEVVIVDDNGLGTDFQKQTQAIIPQNINLKYLPLEKNAGACVARNKGAQIASGEYLFFLDDDDEFLPNKLQIQVDFLNNNKVFDGCLAAFKRIDEKGSEIRAESNYPVVGDFKNFVLQGNFFTPMLCIKKTSFLQSGGFIEISRFQDRFFMINALKKDFKFAALQQQLHIMYEHTQDRITSKSLDKTKKSIAKINAWVSHYRNEFSDKEWKNFQISNLRKIAVTSYNSTDKKIRMSSAAYFFKIFLKTGHFSDLVMMCKSLIK